MRFFNSWTGKFKLPTTKPRLSKEQERARVIFSKDILKRLEDSDFYYCFVDEKWFYITSRRKKFKYLPPAPWETWEEIKFLMPKLRSRRHPTKVMFLGIVAPRCEEKKFDGKIYIKRISKKEKKSKNIIQLKFS